MLHLSLQGHVSLPGIDRHKGKKRFTTRKPDLSARFINAMACLFLVPILQYQCSVIPCAANLSVETSAEQYLAKFLSILLCYQNSVMNENSKRKSLIVVIQIGILVIICKIIVKERRPRLPNSFLFR